MTEPGKPERDLITAHADFTLHSKETKEANQSNEQKHFNSEILKSLAFERAKSNLVDPLTRPWF